MPKRPPAPSKAKSTPQPRTKRPTPGATSPAKHPASRTRAPEASTASESPDAPSVGAPAEQAPKRPGAASKATRAEREPAGPRDRTMPSAEASGVPARSGAEQSVALADLDRLVADLHKVRVLLMDPSVDSKTEDIYWKLVRRAHISLGQRMRYHDDHNHWLGTNIGRLLDLDFLDASAIAAFSTSITPPPPPDVLRSAADIIYFAASAVLRGQRYEGDPEIQTTWARIRKLHNELEGKELLYARVLAETYQAIWNVESNPAGVSGVSRALIVGLIAVRDEYAALDPQWVEVQLVGAKLGKRGRGHGAGALGPARIAAKLSIKCGAFTDLRHKTDKQAGDLFAKQWNAPIVVERKALLARWDNTT